AANIAQVVIVKSSAVTHAFDMDQRLVGLTFTAGSGVLTVTGPPNGNIAPPGYYMLFLINSAGVPSVAEFVQVSSAPTDIPPTGSITNPATDTTISPGQSVTFAGSGTAPSGSIAGYSWVFPGGTPATSSLANPGTVTYSTPGSYTASLTVTDSAGITDPSPVTRTITVTTAPAPTLSGATPISGKQSQTNLSVTLTGSNFLTGPACNFGAGINVTSCTYNSATQITANITIAPSAVTGPRNIVVTDTDGQTAALLNGFTVNQNVTNTINLGSGFTQGSMAMNGSAILSGTKLQITDGNPAGYEAGSAWYSVPANIQSFTTDFSFQITPGTTPTADGMAFVIQGNTTSALGPEGGGLGYGPDYPTNPSASAHVPIAKSVAVKFDVYDNAGEGMDSTGIYTNGVSPTTPAVDMTSS